MLRRTFNKILALLPLAKINVNTTIDDKDYREVVVLPKEFRYPYSPKVKNMIYNRIKNGESKKQIKEWIFSKSILVKVPMKNN